MKDENTIYDEDRTRYDGTASSASAEKPEVDQAEKNADDEKKKKNPMWRNAAAGLGLGVLLGGTSSFMAARAFAGDGSSEDQTPADDYSAGAAAWSDGEIPVATGVNDDMSFSDAFAAAREEVGAGGVFEWHDNLYNTYYAEEWNSLSQDERDEFFEHLRLNKPEEEPQEGDDNSGDEDQADVEQEETDAGQETGTEEPLDTEASAEGDEPEDVEVEGVVADEAGASSEVTAGDVEADASSQQVEVLGVEIDPDTGESAVELMVDGQSVVLIDVDGEDGQFDAMGTDDNGDGHITEDEISEMSGPPVSSDSFLMQEQFGDTDLYAAAEGMPDYVNDVPGDDMA